MEFGEIYILAQGQGQSYVLLSFGNTGTGASLQKTQKNVSLWLILELQCIC